MPAQVLLAEYMIKSTMEYWTAVWYPAIYYARSL